jgi:dTDP-4-dehydrorhamnose 3,5-epimerase
MTAETRPGIRDEQTVTADGRPTTPMIDGVVLHTPPVHLDHRGALFELYNGDPALWSVPIVYSYVFSVRPGQMKGWGMHEFKEDRYSLIVGEDLLFLHDDRPGSPTRGVTQQVVLSERGIRQIWIPRGVWHLHYNPTQHETHFVNFPTEPYQHDAPDRLMLPWDTDELPVDVARFLPRS